MKTTFLQKINNNAAIISGLIIFIVALFSTWEAVARGVLSSPTIWTMDVSRYLIIWALFLGTASALDNKSHIAVDFIREEIGKKWGIGIRRVMAICSYIFALVYVLVLAWSSIDLTKDALRLDKLTLGTIQIPSVYLYVAMIIGSIFMMISIAAIISDIVRKNKFYL